MYAAAFFAVTTAALLFACEVRIGEGDQNWHRLTSDKGSYLDLGGWRVRYIDMGGKGRPVVMVHGFADSAYCWHKNVTPLLDKGFRTILIDQPGMGGSDIPPEGYTYSIENQTSAVIKLVDKLGLSSFDIVGSSMGGGVALHLSLNHKERIGHVILLAPACYKPKGHGMSRLLTLPGASKIASVIVGKWTVSLALKDVYFDDQKVDDMLVDEYSRPLNKPGYMATLASLSADFFSEAFHKMIQRYPEVKPRLLIIWGENDKWLPVGFGRRLHAVVPGSRLHTIKNCGHLPHQERPDEVNPIMLRFLTQQS